MQRRAYALLFASMMSWGIGNPLSDYAMEHVSVGMMLFLEIGAGFTALTIVGLITKNIKRLAPGHMRWAIALGLLQPGITYILGNLGYASGTVTTGLLIMQSEVFILAIFGWMFAHEKVGALDWSAIAFGSLGAIIVGYAASATGHGEILGTLAFAGAAVATAGYSVVVRKFAVKFPDADFFSLVWMQNLVSLGLALLVWPITSQWVSADRTDNPLGIAAGLAAGVFGVAIPFLLFTHASKIVPARHSAIALNIVPVVGISVGALIGRGVPTSLQYLGGAMVLTSLLALSKSAN